ncbi:MAG: hypothetical protein II470_10835, partial [Selenomonas sp.]|nr:hypothetical protein [Selenomonas sp.]
FIFIYLTPDPRSSSRYPCIVSKLQAFPLLGIIPPKQANILLSLYKNVRPYNTRLPQHNLQVFLDLKYTPSAKLKHKDKV